MDLPEEFRAYCRQWHADYGKFQSLEAEIAFGVKAMPAEQRRVIGAFVGRLLSEPYDCDALFQAWWNAGGDSVPARSKLHQVLELLQREIAKYSKSPSRGR